jgi:hypothetical protein
MQFRQKTHRDKDGNIRQGQTVQLMRYTYDAENKRGQGMSARHGHAGDLHTRCFTTRLL